MWKSQKIRVTGCKTLLICWFFLGFVLGLWVIIARFAVDLLIFKMAACEKAKNQSYWLQNTVDLGFMQQQAGPQQQQQQKQKQQQQQQRHQQQN